MMEREHSAFHVDSSMTCCSDKDSERRTLGVRPAFLGAGRMGCALIDAFVQHGVWETKTVVATHRRKEGAREIGQRLNVASTTCNAEAVRGSDMVFLCVRPQDIKELIDDIIDSVTRKHVLISLAIGVPLAWLRARVPQCEAVFHVHPSSLVMASSPGFSYIACEDGVDSHALANVERIFRALGNVAVVPEPLLEAYAVTAGCFPAFLAAIGREWVQTMEQLNIPVTGAESIVQATYQGLAHGMAKRGLTLGHIIDQIATPGGVTQAGLSALHASRLDNILASIARDSFIRITKIRSSFECHELLSTSSS